MVKVAVRHGGWSHREGVSIAGHGAPPGSAVVALGTAAASAQQPCRAHIALGPGLWLGVGQGLGRTFATPANAQIRAGRSAHRRTRREATSLWHAARTTRGAAQR